MDQWRKGPQHGGRQHMLHVPQLDSGALELNAVVDDWPGFVVIVGGVTFVGCTANES